MATTFSAPLIEQAESIARSLIHLACKIPEAMTNEEKAKLHTVITEQTAIITEELDDFFEKLDAATVIRERVLEGDVPPPDC
jgi:hypothetical protein